MGPGLERAQGATRAQARREGAFRADCALAASTMTLLLGCTTEVQSCPDFVGTRVDVPGGMFAPAEARRIEVTEGLPLVAIHFPRGAIDPVMAASTTDSGGRPAYDAVPLASPPQGVPSAILVVDRTLGIITRSYTDEQGRLVQERWRFKESP